MILEWLRASDLVVVILSATWLGLIVGSVIGWMGRTILPRDKASRPTFEEIRDRLNFSQSRRCLSCGEPATRNDVCESCLKWSEDRNSEIESYIRRGHGHEDCIERLRRLRGSVQ